MTQSANNALHLPAVVRAFATTRVMSGLRPTHRDSANPRNRGGQACTPSTTINQLMQAMVAQATEAKS